MMPTPVRNVKVLPFAVKSQTSENAMCSKLTVCLRVAGDIQIVVDQATGEVRTTQCIERAVVQLGDIADDYRSSIQANIFDTILLGTLSPNDGILGCCNASTHYWNIWVAKLPLSML